MKFKNVVLAPVLVLLFCAYVKGMKCYQCRSDVDDNCAKDVAEKFLQICSLQRMDEDLIHCRKTVQKLHFLDGKTVIIRECASVYEEEECYQMLSPDAVVNSCDCEGSGCNVATKLKGGVTNCLFVIVALFIVRFFPP